MKSRLNKDYTIIKWDEFFVYDENSPSGLTWKHNNKPAGCLAKRKDGTASTWYVCWQYKNYVAHKIILTMIGTEIPSGYVIDHVDGDASNNKISNLCVKSHRENMQNLRKRKDNKSGVTGVYYSFYSKSWVAFWFDIDSKMKTKSFKGEISDEKSKSLAVECRKNEILKLNQQGQNYTERHNN